MTYTIPIYAPNLSKENLIKVMHLNLEPDVGEVVLEPQPGKVQFRAPELLLKLPDATEAQLHTVLHVLIASARVLGGSQFVFRGEGHTMRERSTEITADQLAHLLVAFGHQVGQVDIY